MNSKLTEEELEKYRSIRIHTLLGVPDNGRRTSMQCPLPNHNDSTPSFSLYPDNSYKCFGCGAYGNGAIDFLLELDATFQEAVEELDNYL